MMLFSTWQYCTDPATGCSQTTNFNDVTNRRSGRCARRSRSPSGVPSHSRMAHLSVRRRRSSRKRSLPTAWAQKRSNVPIKTSRRLELAPIWSQISAPTISITYVANPHYREAGKPFFQTVVLKGGGDAEFGGARGAANRRSRLCLEPASDAASSVADGSRRRLVTVVSAFGTQVERIILNQTNPDPALGDMRSVWAADGSNAHPFLTNPAV